MSIVKHYLNSPATHVPPPPPSRNGEQMLFSDGSPYGVIIGNADGTPFTINGVQLWIGVLYAIYRKPNIRWNLYPLYLGNVMSNCESVGQFASIEYAPTEADLARVSYIPDEKHSSVYNTAVLTSKASYTDSYGRTGCAQERACYDLMRWTFPDGLNFFAQNPIVVPSIQALARVWQRRNFIDSLDPTVNDYGYYSLAQWGFSGVYNGRVFSSSQPDPSRAVVVRADGYLELGSRYTADYGFLPIIEIPV